MKRKLLTAFALSTAVMANAQKTQFGLNTSYVLNKLKGDGMENTWQAGYSAGLYAEWPFAKNWSLQPELSFIERAARAGSDFKSIYPETSYYYLNKNVGLHYLSLPVLLNYKLNDNWQLNAGPQYDYLLSSNENLLKTDQSSFKKYNLGLNAGLQFKLAALRLYGRYTYGLTDVNNINAYHQWHARGFSFGLGWRFF